MAQEIDWAAIDAETRRLFGVVVGPPLTEDDPRHPYYVPQKVANTDLANSREKANSPTYRYRDSAARRAYMRDYMRKRRAGRTR